MSPGWTQFPRETCRTQLTSPRETNIKRACLISVLQFLAEGEIVEVVTLSLPLTALNCLIMRIPFGYVSYVPFSLLMPEKSITARPGSSLNNFAYNNVNLLCFKRRKQTAAMALVKVALPTVCLF